MTTSCTCQRDIVGITLDIVYHVYSIQQLIPFCNRFDNQCHVINYKFPHLVMMLVTLLIMLCHFNKKQTIQIMNYSNFVRCGMIR